MTIGNYLGKYQLIKPLTQLLPQSISVLFRAGEENSTNKVVSSNFLMAKIGKYLAFTNHKLTNTNLIIIVTSSTTILVELSTLLYIVYMMLYTAQSIS